MNERTHPDASKKVLKSSHSHPKPIAIPKQCCEFAEFLGMYYGDGSATENPPAVRYLYRILKKENIPPSYANYLKEYLE